MQYVAITQQTSSWLLGHTEVLTALHDAFSQELSVFREAEFSSGPLRIAGSADGRVLAIWNREYLSGTGSEQWGLIKLQGEHSLDQQPAISQQVFERALYVLNQRLQNLVIEGDFIHRPWPNGSHTCLAGRGNEARKFSIVYFEGGPGYADLSAKAIIILGPEHDFDKLQSAIDAEVRNFSTLVDIAGKIVDVQRRRPLLEAPAFQALRESLTNNRPQLNLYSEVNVSTGYQTGDAKAYEVIHWDYTHWLRSGILSDAQRRVLNADLLQKHPVRIIGPAGSGKTLLMQLLALRYLHEAKAQDKPLRVMYAVHNIAMAQNVADRLRTLGAEEYLTDKTRELVITTLSEYGRNLIGLVESMVIDKDAHKTKLFQLEQVRIALRDTLDVRNKIVQESSLLRQVSEQEQLFDLFSILVMGEISTVIKGRGLTEERERYTNYDAPLSRLHGILNTKERGIVFDTFLAYHQVVFEQYEMLDSDDVALSLAGRLRTPVWKLKRKTEAFDYVFVDEAQLFNENERRVFAYLTKGLTPHIPIALALDEAQEPFGFSAAGLATLGIIDAQDEQLPLNHRSTREIIGLAFFVIQRTTDLFGSEFPDFTKLGVEESQVVSPQAASPVVVRCNEGSPSFSRFILRAVQRLRSKNIRQIAVICHAESYWAELSDELASSQLPIHIIEQRGEKLSPDQPLVVLSRPAFVGGQEFDAVILVGLEQGIMPPRVNDNPPLSAALEQQVLRETYLAVSRARFRVIIALNRHASPNNIIEEAMRAELLTEGGII